MADRLKEARALGYYENAHHNREIGFSTLSQFRFDREAEAAFRAGWEEAEKQRNKPELWARPEPSNLETVTSLMARMFEEMGALASAINRTEAMVSALHGEVFGDEEPEDTGDVAINPPVFKPIEDCAMAQYYTQTDIAKNGHYTRADMAAAAKGFLDKIEREQINKAFYGYGDLGEFGRDGLGAPKPWPSIKDKK